MRGTMFNERLGAPVSRSMRVFSRGASVPAHPHAPICSRSSVRRPGPCKATPAGGPDESMSRSEDNHPDAASPQPKLGSKASTEGTTVSDMGQQRRSRAKPTTTPTTVETPLRETNRDVMLGVLTLRAARTLIVYLQETNINVCYWLVNYMHTNPINLQGNWQDVSGDTFLKGLLSMPIQEARFDRGCDPLHQNASACDVDPRSIAQRILAIRAQLATELIQDMQQVSEDNSDLLQRCFRSSLERSLKLPEVADVEPAAAAANMGRGAGADN